MACETARPLSSSSHALLPPALFPLPLIPRPTRPALRLWPARRCPHRAGERARRSSRGGTRGRRWKKRNRAPLHRRHRLRDQILVLPFGAFLARCAPATCAGRWGEGLCYRPVRFPAQRAQRFSSFFWAMRRERGGDGDIVLSQSSHRAKAQRRFPRIKSDLAKKKCKQATLTLCVRASHVAASLPLLLRQA